MIELKARNNEELLRKIDEELKPGVVEVYVNLRPTKEIVVRILKRAPTVKVIGCPPSLYPKVSKKVISALDRVGIKLIPIKHPRGRPKKYDDGIKERVDEMIRRGKSLKEISEELGIPLRTLYYMVNGK
ncbi:hypothetical protein PAP_07115 [Palaeococcus pacificus DY20341]|uniref:DNA-binding protein n=1 Tax=Palaeococcus pacificus DY20341 TaxID=1343739 RepID=A0A075LZ21_9EURY|nr:DUF1699 family protein [Palaeococcus pacificus]AIF69813.1 hypothetical protein PAP_07115 [Palaeococcus pacificus DY20341]